MRTTADHEDTKYFEEHEEDYRRVFLRALRTLRDFVRRDDGGNGNRDDGGNGMTQRNGATETNQILSVISVASLLCVLPLSPSPPFPGAASGVSRAEIIDRVLAVVAGQIITLTDVTAARDLRLETTDGAADPIGAVLSRLIDRELILAEVERYAPAEPTPEEIEREMARVRERFASPEALADALARSGIDEPHLRGTLRQNLRIRAYMDQRFAATGDRRQELVDQWLTGLRRRADVIDLYLPGR
jgi:hypothetical protein